MGSKPEDQATEAGRKAAAKAAKKAAEEKREAARAVDMPEQETPTIQDTSAIQDAPRLRE